MCITLNILEFTLECTQKKMSSLKIITLLTIISLATSKLSTPNHRIYEYNHTLNSKSSEYTPGQNLALPDWTFIVDQLIREKIRTPAIQQPSWSYALCDKQVSDHQRDFECTVYHETHDMNNGITYRDECQVILENVTESEFRSFIRVYRFSRNKSIFIWQSCDNILHIDVVSFPDCEISRMRLQLTQKLTECSGGCVDVAVRNDMEFDVFFAKVKKDCTVWYVTSYNENGRILREAKEFLVTSSVEHSHSSIMDRFSIIPMTQNSSVQKHLILAMDYQSKSHSWFVDKNGNRTRIPTDADIHIATTSHDRLGFCTIENYVLKCQQLDDRGVKILEKTIKLQHHGLATPDYLGSHVYGFRVATMHNLKGGGFILVTEDCVSLKVCTRPADPYRLYLFKVGKDGERYRTIVVKDLSRERMTSHYVEPYGILENGEGEYCLFKNYVLKGRENSMQLVVECFSDELLSRSY